jgi:hypothetical protein
MAAMRGRVVGIDCHVAVHRGCPHVAVTACALVNTTQRIVARRSIASASGRGSAGDA